MNARWKKPDSDGETRGKTKLVLQPGLRRIPGAWFPQSPSGPPVPQLRFTEELGSPLGRSQIKWQCLGTWERLSQGQLLSF